MLVHNLYNTENLTSLFLVQSCHSNNDTKNNINNDNNKNININNNTKNNINNDNNNNINMSKGFQHK